MNVCVCLKGGRSPYLYWWCFVFRLPKIKEWIDARDPGAAIIPFSGELESKVSIIRNYSILNCIWEKIPLGKNQWDFLEGYFYRWSISQFVSSVFSKWTMHSTFIGTFQARIITLNIIFKPLMQRSEVTVKCLRLLWGLWKFENRFICQGWRPFLGDILFPKPIGYPIIPKIIYSLPYDPRLTPFTKCLLIRHHGEPQPATRHLVIGQEARYPIYWSQTQLNKYKATSAQVVRSCSLNHLIWTVGSEITSGLPLVNICTIRGVNVQ